MLDQYIELDAAGPAVPTRPPDPFDLDSHRIFRADIIAAPSERVADAVLELPRIAVLELYDEGGPLPAYGARRFASHSVES